MKGKMRERGMMNAMRSGLVVLGAVAFGYLTLQLGFRPFLERAQRTLELEQLDSQIQNEIDNDTSQFHPQDEHQSFDFSDSSSSSSTTV
ncbi:hypothetical protein RND81_05G144400 [Saponaria officinalis]|uniref:Uncharacterized protein n=1 Tax=Saponaria officinalis TaxID=3572 RepID=A0AAW1KWP5_SAPOF